MEKIILTEEQMKIIRQAKGQVSICDPTGLVVGTVDPEVTPEFIAEMKRRAKTGPWLTGKQIQNHLQALQEAWDREGPFDEKRMKEILQNLRATDHS